MYTTYYKLHGHSSEVSGLFFFQMPLHIEKQKGKSGQDHGYQANNIITTTQSLDYFSSINVNTMEG